MSALRFASSGNLRIGAWLFGCASLVAVLLAAPAVSAGDDATLDDAAAPPVQPAPQPVAGADEFVPINKLVPKAKIVSKENKRLPDLKGEATFASFGKRVDLPFWTDSNPPVPMYPFAYNPIYIEDMNLERCGLSCGCCVQPVVSGLHFFGSIALLPYKVLVSPPCSCVYPPGECPPCFRFSHCENLLGPAPSLSRWFKQVPPAGW